MSKKILRIDAARARLKREAKREGWEFHTVRTAKQKIKYGEGNCFILDENGDVLHKGTLMDVLVDMELICVSEDLQSVEDYARSKAEEYKRNI